MSYKGDDALPNARLASSDLAAIAIDVVIASNVGPAFLYDSGRWYLFHLGGCRGDNLRLLSGSVWGERTSDVATGHAVNRSRLVCGNVFRQSVSTCRAY